MAHFWYSKKQAEHFSKNNKMLCGGCFKINYAHINGVCDDVRYTTAYFNKKPMSLYEDAEYLGEGIHSHSEGTW